MYGYFPEITRLCIYNYMFFNNMKLYVNAAVIIYGFAIFFSPILIRIRQERFLGESLPIYSTYKMSFTGRLRAGLSVSGSSKKRSVHMVK